MIKMFKRLSVGGDLWPTYAIGFLAGFVAVKTLLDSCEEDPRKILVEVLMDDKK